jgi:hypothetical protein
MISKLSNSMILPVVNTLLPYLHIGIRKLPENQNFASLSEIVPKKSQRHQKLQIDFYRFMNVSTVVLHGKFTDR